MEGTNLFELSEQNQNQKSSYTLKKLRKSTKYSKLISQLDELPEHEVCVNGLTHLALGSFKELYGLVEELLELPELEEEPALIFFDDCSYALSWWKPFVC